jgi:sialate O-acetylesterase
MSNLKSGPKNLSFQWALKFFVAAIMAGGLLFAQEATTNGTASSGSLRVANIFSDRCVLQREMPLPIWGSAQPGAKVDVELADRKGSALADEKGRWQVTFDPFPAGGPDSIKIRSGAEAIEVKDVLIGEVWIGVGQSNMIMGVGSCDGAAEAMARFKDYPNMRFAAGQAQSSESPAQDINKTTWGPPTSGSSAVSFYFAEMLYNHLGGNVPVGIVNQTIIAPAEAWSNAERLKAYPALARIAGHKIFPHLSGQVFNGTIKPLVPFAIRGALYYQGEMNAGRGVQFRLILAALIESWREAWGRPDLPFLFVQLASFEEHKKAADGKLDMRSEILSKLKNAGQDHGFSLVRESQLHVARTVPGVGMAVAIDAGEQWDIHPKNKKTVGERLFLLARAKAYGEKGVSSAGPMPKEAKFGKDRVTITFDLEAGTSLVAKSDPLAGFELAGEDRIFHKAEAKIDGNTIEVRCQAVPEPIMVHYAWAGFPEVGLYDNTGLPSTPFRLYDFSRIVNQQDSAELEFGGVETLKSKDAPGWELTGNATFTALPDGASVLDLKVEKDTFFQNSGKIDVSYAWNANPLSSKFIRPGSVVGFSFELAATPEGPARVYVRPANNHQAGGQEIWGPAVFVENDLEEFRKIHMARQIQSPRSDGDSIGLLFALVEPKPGQPILPVRVRGLSRYRVLRPILQVSSAKPLDLGAIEVGTTAESKPLMISNGQKATFPQNLNANTDPVEVPTILHGLADLRSNVDGPVQSVLQPGDSVGAILLGDGFELIGANVSADGQSLKFLGADGKPGLLGGSNAEQETFTVRFKGAKALGKFSATLRIVTQATNLGTLSQGQKNEPPANLHYLDIPIHVSVK